MSPKKSKPRDDYFEAEKEAWSVRSVWILTREVNDYDQHGEYYEAAFATKPDTEELARHFGEDVNGNFKGMNVMEAVSLISHILKGGGRRGTEDVWYNLKEVKL